MFAFGGLKRTYILHVPPGPPTGLVLNLHGGGSSGAGQQRLTDFDSAADANNLLVVYPNGYDKSWADGRGAAPADRRHLDDNGFLVALVGKVQKDFGVPAGHVFATGMSNGGFMSNRLACDRADVFAAIAPIAGTLAWVCRAIRPARCRCWRRTVPQIGWCPSREARCAGAAGSAAPSRPRA